MSPVAQRKNCSPSCAVLQRSNRAAEHADLLCSLPHCPSSQPVPVPLGAQPGLHKLLPWLQPVWASKPAALSGSWSRDQGPAWGTAVRVPPRPGPLPAPLPVLLAGGRKRALLCTSHEGHLPWVRSRLLPALVQVAGLLGVA